MSAERHELELVREEWGLVLQGLAELPFKDVFELVGRINALAHRAEGEELVTCELSRRELGLCLKGVGELPYSKVHALVERMREQVSGAGRDDAP